MSPRLLAAVSTCALATTAASPALGEPGVAAHALVVGSNAAGPGQTELRYAEEDARRVGAILTELGGYAPASVDVLLKPTPASLRERLARLEQRVAADAKAGKQVRVFFYYSGHARATAIDLGADALPLAELRQRLFGVSSTLTVVVLDACQSGAFSRVKGASPTADFSFNSRQQLDSSGVAVLASSSGSELSQESEQLRSSYFTHHLLVGMRGAADANRDGQVSVDEAYRYAYHQTLLATAATAVGSQHVTLEVDLKGHGEVALSYPRAASAAIELPADLAGQTLVADRRAQTVVAETHKVRGASVRIAVAPGQYEVTVRQGDRLRRCQVSAPGAVDLSRCTNEAVVTATTPKSGVFLGAWRVELSLAFGEEREGPYTETLRTFEFRGTTGSRGFGASVTREIWRTPNQRALAGVFAHDYTGDEWERTTELNPLRFKWATTHVGLIARFEQHLARRPYVYADATAGLGIGRTLFADADSLETRDRYYGFTTSIGAGFGARKIVLGYADFILGVRYSRAAVLKNDIGDTHDSGGFHVGLAMAAWFGGGQ